MPDVLKIYTFKLCPFAQRVRLVLAEKGLAAEAIEVDLKSKPADFLAVSPYGRVPVLLHVGARLWESAVIMEYLDEAFPEPRLMPDAPVDRATVRLWVDFANSRLFSSTHRMIFEKGDAQRRSLIAQMQSDLVLLEASLRDRRVRGPYLLGSQLTLADIALYPWFEQLPTLEKLSPFRIGGDCPAIADWTVAIAARLATRQCAQSDDTYAEHYRRYLAS